MTLYLDKSRPALIYSLDKLCLAQEFKIGPNLDRKSRILHITIDIFFIIIGIDHVIDIFRVI